MPAQVGMARQLQAHRYSRRSGVAMVASVRMARATRARETKWKKATTTAPRTDRRCRRRSCVRCAALSVRRLPFCRSLSCHSQHSRTRMHARRKRRPVECMREASNACRPTPMRSHSSSTWASPSRGGACVRACVRMLHVVVMFATLFVYSRKALQLNRNNAQLAMEWLLEHEDDADADTPLTPAEFAR